MLDVDLEGSSVCGSLYAHRLSHSMQTHRSDQSQVLAPVLGHLAVSSRSPLGARERSRSIEMCVPLSSTNTNRLKHRSERTAIATELSLPRRVLGLVVTFFERPPSRKPTDIAAHRSLRDLHGTLIEESLAMLG